MTVQELKELINNNNIDESAQINIVDANGERTALDPVNINIYYDEIIFFI